MAIPRTTSRARRVAFYVFTVIGALMFGGLFAGVPALVTTWYMADPEGHRIHGLTHGITSGFLIAGAFLVQLRAPERNVAALQQAVLVTAFLLGFYLIGAPLAGNDMQPVIVVFMAIAVASVAIPLALHPARGAFLTRGRISGPLAAFAAIGGIGAALYAAGQLGLQFGPNGADVHGKAFHYGGAASAALGIAATALLASLRPSGWRISAWMAGIAAILFGLGGVLYTEPLSSLGTTAGAAAIAAGAAFIAVAEREAR